LSAVVLDASALLAMLFEEPGGKRVEEVIQNALISAVNLSEVGAVISDRGADLGPVFGRLEQLQLNIRPFDELIR
jgi:ribonuclease VapC